MTERRRSFLDSNVVLYLLSADAAKADIAERLLTTRPTISVQILNEVAHANSRKLRMDWRESAAFLDLVRGFCKVVPMTEQAHDRARALAERQRPAFYDACIAAAAMAARCTTLYGEDMNHLQRLGDGLSILNPFIDGDPPDAP